MGITYFKKLENFVFSKVLVSFTQDFIVDIGNSERVLGHFIFLKNYLFIV